MTNVGLTDKTALLLSQAIEKSKTLRVLNVETNFISPPVIVALVRSLLKARTVEEFRASNQVSIYRYHFILNLTFGVIILYVYIFFLIQLSYSM